MSAATTGNGQLIHLEEYLKNYPEMEQVNMGAPIEMADGNTLLSVILIFPTQDKPPDLNIHVKDDIAVEVHYGGAPE